LAACLLHEGGKQCSQHALHLSLEDPEVVQLLADYHGAVEGLLDKGKLETSPMAKSLKGGVHAEIERRNMGIVLVM
jgi:hypothetical protein